MTIGVRGCGLAILVLAFLHIVRGAYGLVYIMPAEKRVPEVLVPGLGLNLLLLLVAIGVALRVRQGRLISAGAAIVGFYLVGWLVWLAFVTQQHYPFPWFTYVLEGLYVSWIVGTLAALFPHVK